MPKIDINKIDQIIREVAAAEAMPRFRKLAAGDVEMKGVNDPVTIADKETERHLSERLIDYLPGSVIVGEETFAKDKSIMEHIGREHPVWIIDPIDGTRNFVEGIPEFSTMVALVQNGQPIAGWIHDPNSGDTVMGEKGGGVWLRGKKLRLAAAEPGVPTVGLVGARVKKLISDPSVMPKATDVPAFEIGSCAGFDYPRMFVGEATYANATTPRAGYLFYRHTNAWDHAPGYFLHGEAGGYGADWSGKPYDLRNSRGGLLLAPSKELWVRLHGLFEPVMLHTLQKAS